MATWRTAGSASAFLNSPARHLRRNSRPLMPSSRRAARSNRRTSAARVSRPMRLGAAVARGVAAFAFRFDRFARLMSPQDTDREATRSRATATPACRRGYCARDAEVRAALPEPVERLVVEERRIERQAPVVRRIRAGAVQACNRRPVALDVLGQLRAERRAPPALVLVEGRGGEARHLVHGQPAALTRD